MNNFFKKKLNIIVIFLGLVNVILLFIFDIPCPWKKSFNIDCAGCGGTRMLKSLFKLKFYQAFRFNPLLFCLLFIGIFYIIYYIISKIKKNNYYKIKDRDIWILLVVVIVFMILRNIKGLEFLKPSLISYVSFGIKLNL